MKKSSDPRGDIHKDGILKIIEDISSRYSFGRVVKCMRLSRQTVNEHLNKLVEDGKVEKIGRGRYLPANSPRASITPHILFFKRPLDKPILNYQMSFSQVDWLNHKHDVREWLDQINRAIECPSLR